MPHDFDTTHPTGRCHRCGWLRPVRMIAPPPAGWPESLGTWACARCAEAGR